MRKLSYAFLAAACTALPCQAQSETIVISATRTPQPLESTGESISVITAEDLQTQQAEFAGDALMRTPGSTLVRNGGAGQPADVLLRGAEAGQTLVLIDGIRINDPSATTGFALLGDVMADGIDRIEVLRGPQSTLYGSDAIGGVVNILTKRGGPSAITLEAEGGSFKTYRFNAAANGAEGPVEYGAVANYYGTNSISAADSRNGNSEADGYHHLGATVNTRWQLMDGVSFDARAYYTRARDSFDGYPPPNYTFQDTHEYGRNTLLAAYGGINADFLGGRWSNRLAAIRSDSDRKTFDPTLSPAEDFYAKGKATRFEYQGVVDVDGANQASFGAESQTTKLETHSIYDPGPQATTGSDRSNGYYAQWQTKPVDTLTLTAGIRYDDDRAFKGHTSVKLAGAWQVTPSTIVRGNYGDGFKAPSLYELDSPYSSPTQSLRPETARGWEAGIDRALGDARIGVTYFERRTKDQIDFFSCFGVVSTACTLRAAQGGYYYNVDHSRARGVEAAFSARLADALKFQANYSYLADTDLATGLQLARRPMNAANAILTWSPTDAVSIGCDIDFVGKRFDDAGHFTPLGAAEHANLFVSYRVRDGFAVFGRAENVFNDRTEPAAGYGAPGRAIYAGVRTDL